MDIERLDMEDILEGYRKRRFKPSEVVQAYLDTIERQNPSLNAFLQVQPELTLSRARELDQKIQAMSCYKSQAHKSFASADFIIGLAITRGTQIGGGLAEVFEVLRMVI